jgi:hypothetical protein
MGSRRGIIDHAKSTTRAEIHISGSVASPDFALTGPDKSSGLTVPVSGDGLAGLNDGPDQPLWILVPHQIIRD